MSPVESYGNCYPTQIYLSDWETYSTNYGYSPRKVETKKERVKRVAREKMLASYKLFNQKKEKVIQVIQNAKPKHRIYNFKR